VGHIFGERSQMRYTLLVSAISEIQNLHYLPVPYNAITDFSQIEKIVDGPALVLIVNANSFYRSVPDLIADAKKNVGKFNIATSGPATSSAIAVDQLNALAGTNIVPVSYRGTGPAAAAVLRQSRSRAVANSHLFRQLRKAFGAELKRRGVHTEERSDLLRHAGKTVDEESYVDPTECWIRRIADYGTYRSRVRR
jgi:tripartite-type tricarboxylate transporter receptor subunit TctC